MSFLNGTLMVLAYTAEIMSNISEKTDLRNISAAQNVSTTTLSPVELENRFDLDDQWHMWRCYEPYGCFYIGSPWSGDDRPVSEFPVRPDRINPRYTLYTRKQNGKPHELKIDDFETIRNSPLNRTNTLYFIIHGYLDNGKTWVLRVMEELLLREDCNIVIVNWLAGAGPPYTQAVANTRLVGAMTARLIAQLIEIMEIPPSESKTHCIGHSLGAHTCGYVGYNMREQYKVKLARITGLDPAEPHFSNTHTMVRLDPTDATFVTVIHTDCNLFINLGLGITQAVGHIDFYPNSGRNQPGCNETMLSSITVEHSFVHGLKKHLGCNHIRSYEYFIESINSQCPFIAVPCSSWEKFQKGDCFDCVTQYCPRIGLDAQPGNYHASVYLMTGHDKPFCKAHYKVTINISRTDESLSHGGDVGMFVIHVIGANGKQTERMQLSPTSKYYEPGSSHTIVLPGDVVGKPDSVEIVWEYQYLVFNPLTWRFHTSRAYIDSLTVINLETNHGVTLCPDSKTLFANQPKILTTENCQDMEHNAIAT